MGERFLGESLISSLIESKGGEIYERDQDISVQNEGGSRKVAGIF
jgi:hypothetical protein